VPPRIRDFSSTIPIVSSTDSPGQSFDLQDDILPASYQKTRSKTEGAACRTKLKWGWSSCPGGRKSGLSFVGRLRAVVRIVEETHDVWLGKGGDLVEDEFAEHAPEEMESRLGWK